MNTDKSSLEAQSQPSCFGGVSGSASSRAIKFRALDNLGAWIYGIPQTSSTLHLTLDCMAQYFTEQRKYGRQNVIIKPETIGQFTGLKDKKGTDIYEGDIIDTELTCYCFVEYSEEYGEWMFVTVDGIRLSKRENYNREVVGNIFESPELLVSPADR